MASNVVPYTPVPSAAPNAAPASPYLRVPSGTQEAAGVGVAQATQGLGNAVQQASDKVSQQVLALQSLDNETWAKDNDVTGMVKTGQIVSEFDQLEGKNAIDRLPEFQDRIKKVRQELLDSAPNPMARRMLDQALSRRVGFALVDMGHKSGTQLRAANKRANNAQIETAIATTDPTPNGITLGEKTIKGAAQQRGEQQGDSEETIANDTRKDLSKLWLTSINNIGPKNPEAAKAIFDLRKDQMDPQFREVAENRVNTFMASKQTRIDAQEILDKIGFDPTKGPGQEMKALDLAKKYVEKKGKDNPTYADYLDTRVKGLINTGMQGYRDQQQGYKNDLGKFILGQNDANRVVSIDGLTGPDAPPEIQKAFAGLDRAGQKMIMNWVHKMATGEANQWTPQKMMREKQLRGMASDPQQTKDFYEMGPEAIIKEGFPNGATRSLLQLQNTVKTRAENVQLNQAMSLADSQLRSAGIARDQDKDAYNQFRGAMEDQIRDLQGETKGKITPEQIRVLTSQLLREQATSHWYNPASWGTDTGPTYAPMVPEKDRGEVQQMLLDKGYVNPTEQDIQRQYSYLLYKRLYDKKSQPKSDKGNLEGLGQ